MLMDLLGWEAAICSKKSPEEQQKVSTWYCRDRYFSASAAAKKASGVPIESLRRLAKPRSAARRIGGRGICRLMLAYAWASTIGRSLIVQPTLFRCKDCPCRVGFPQMASDSDPTNTLTLDRQGSFNVRQSDDGLLPDRSLGAR
jgi:hypothetical protein